MLSPVAYISCCECGETVGAFERGWRAYLEADERDDVQEVAVFCPVCATREFGAKWLADTDETD